MLFGDIYCFWAGSRNFTPHSALTSLKHRVQASACFFHHSTGGESSLSSFPGFSCGLQHGVQPRQVTPGLEGSLERACGAGRQLTARALPRGAAVSRGTLQGAHPSGTGMKAPVPSLCGDSMGGRVRCSSWVLGEPCLAPGSVAGFCQQRSNQTCTFC